MVIKNDITKAVTELGIKKGDTVLVHSSFKSLGDLENGAETVIEGFLDTIGPDGTLVFPTFCQKDFHKCYETWHLDKDSEVGYLTNYFRKRKGSKRSNHPTHSVAACGKNADFLTETHGHTHKRFGDMGDTPFSADSPWEKMYKDNAKIVGLGVNAQSFTFRHYAEYIFIEKCLINLEKSEKYEEMKNRLHCYEKSDRLDPWPRTDNLWTIERLKEKNLTKTSTCGNATLISAKSQDFVDFVLECLENEVTDILWIIEEAWDIKDWLKWYDDYKKLVF